MKQSPLVGSCSYSRILRCFFLLYFCIFSVPTTNAQIHHRRLWPWPTSPWPYPMRPWPWEPSPRTSSPPPPPKPQPGPAPCPPPNPQPKPPPGPGPCPPTPPKPQPPPGPGPCPPTPPKPQPPPGPGPCPPTPPKPQPPPGPSPCPPPPPKPQPPPGPSPCPPTPPKPQPPPGPSPPKPPVPTPKPGPPPPGPTPIAPPGPAPKPTPPKPPSPNPKPIPPKPPSPNPSPNPTPPKPKQNISAVFFFGDSIFDTGNNNNRSTKVKSNYRPYGMDFKFGVATGRFGNGKVASDYISQYLGVKEIVPAYLDPKLQKDIGKNPEKQKELLTGVSFASAGGGYDPTTSKSTSAIPMLDQLTFFQDYKEKVKKLAGEEKRDEVLSKGVAIVVAGGNDLINTYFGSGAQRLKNDVDAFTTIMADSAASFVLQLNGYGVTRIGVIGTPPLGCAPAQRSRKRKKCNEEMNYASQLFNSKLLIILGQMSKTLKESKLVYIDVYSIFSEMIENHGDYGFEDVKNSCCKTSGALCSKSTSKICSNTSSYLFWDGFHPTQRASQLLNKVIVKEYLHTLSR